MADNFDLKKFLKENKALENLNPTIKSLNETSFSDRGNTQDYDSSTKENPDGTYDISNVMKETLKSRIKEYILSELSENDPDDDDPEGMAYGDYYDEEEVYFPTMGDLEDKPVGDYYEGDLEEAKKKDEEEVEVTDTETEEAPAEEAPAEEAPAADGGLEDIAANMEGTESELMKNLMDALQIAKGMGNEKLETQIGNTLKFFVSEYIGSGQE